MQARAGASKVQAEWAKCLELEKKLKAALRKQSFYDAEPRQLRQALRSGYESLLFLDAAFAAANDAEQALWKSVYYKPIEEFRARLRKAEKAGEPAREQLVRTLTAFLKFLEDAALFYKRLVTQLQGAYGDVGVKLDLPPAAAQQAAAALTALRQAQLAAAPAEAGGGGGGGAGGAGGADSGARTASGGSLAGSAPRDPRASVHRCLIYLGDLSRYSAQASPKAAALGAELPPGPAASAAATAAASGAPPAAVASAAGRADYHRAAQCYKMAARVLPRSGNPFNQLAVMAYYAGDELRAVYYYFRSLCVSRPFLTARENLLLLFEQNRVKHAALGPPLDQQRAGAPPRAAPQLAGEVSVRFVRVSGILFDRVNAEEWPAATGGAFAALDALLAHPHAREQMQRQPRADAFPLHLVVAAIFGVHNTAGEHVHKPGGGAPGGGGGGHGGDGGRRAMRSRALAALFRVGAALCGCAAEWTEQQGPASPGCPHLLVACHVLMQWLAAHPQYAAAPSAAAGASHSLQGLEPAAAASLAAAAADESRRRADFWPAAARLVAALAAAAPEAAARQAAAWRAGRSGGGRLARAGSGPLEDASMEGGALPEELELLGFEPLSSKHRGHAVGHALDAARGGEEEALLRAARLLHEARAVAAALEAAEAEAAAAAADRGGGTAAAAASAGDHKLAAAARAFVLAAGGDLEAAGAALREQQEPGQPLMWPARGAARHEPMDVDVAPRAAAGAAAGAASAYHQQQQQLHQQQQQQQRQQQQGDAMDEEDRIEGELEEQEDRIEEEDEEEEEVIVFQPRRSAPGGPAAAAGAQPTSPTWAAAAAAAAGAAAPAAPPPPLPQALLQHRQLAASAGPSPASSPGGAERPASPGLQAAGAAAAAGAGAAAGAPPAGRRMLGPIPLSVVMASGAPASAAAAGQQPQRRPQQQLQQQQGQEGAPPASTERDLQQSHAASAQLLARLAARAGGGAGEQQQQQPPVYGGYGYQQQQEQQQQAQQQQQLPSDPYSFGQPPYGGGYGPQSPTAGPAAAGGAAPFASAADYLAAPGQPRRQQPLLVPQQLLQQQAAITAVAGAMGADGGFLDIPGRFDGGRASLELEETARAAALHILSPGAREGEAAAAAAMAAASARAAEVRAAGAAEARAAGAAEARAAGALGWQPQAAAPPQPHQPRVHAPAALLPLAPAPHLGFGGPGSGSGRSILAASGASSLADTPRSNVSAHGPGGHPFGAPHGAAAAAPPAPPALVAASHGEFLRLGSASLAPPPPAGGPGFGAAPGFGGGAGGGGGGGGPDSASGYAMFGGPDLFSDALPGLTRHRRQSSGFGSGRSSAADSGGAPARTSSPGLSLLEHLAEQQALVQQGAAGAPPQQHPHPQQQKQQQQQQQQPAAVGGGDAGGMFAFGEALFPPGRGPGTILPPRDAGGAHNPFA